MASTKAEDMMRMQRMLDPRSVATEQEMMGQSLGTSMIDPGSVARQEEIEAIGGARNNESIPMSVVDQVNALMQMGLTEDEALEAIAIERSAGQIQPQDFGGQRQMQQPNQMSGNMQPMQPSVNPGMGALSGVPAGNERPMVMPTPRPEDLMMMQMPSGRDRTFNPRDALNPYNAPNT
tara:strand:+ start:3839 stop:4372 length:534 start_codon:yes stop_codon:yes gene_type:complete